MKAVSNPVVIVSVLVSVWNLITDPTTKGLSDSTQAMTQDQKVRAKKAAGQPERPVAKEPEVDAELQGVNPHFLDFLDADTYGRKYDIVTEMEEELDDHLINQMAASIDEIIEDGRLEDRILQLEACLRTKARYELNRAR